MTRIAFRDRGKPLFRTSCWLYSQLLSLYPDDLYTRYGEEMQWVFREELKRAIRKGSKEYMAVWRNVLHDTALQVGPPLVPRLGIMSVAITGALAIMLVSVSFSLPVRLPEIGGSCLPKIYSSSNVLQPKQTVSSNGILGSGRRRVLQHLSHVPVKATKRSP
jgi:hypothetical protein